MENIRLIRQWRCGNPVNGGFYSQWYYSWQLRGEERPPPPRVEQEEEEVRAVQDELVQEESPAPGDSDARRAADA